MVAEVIRGCWRNMAADIAQMAREVNLWLQQGRPQDVVIRFLRDRTTPSQERVVRGRPGIAKDINEKRA